MPVFEIENFIFLHFFYHELPGFTAFYYYFGDVGGVISNVFLESDSNKIPFL
jgi:hypothetical protein